MPRFLYYFPGLSGMNRQMLAQRGLLPRFTMGGGNLVQWSVVAVNEGPQGAGAGCIVMAGSAAPRYEPAGQHWIQGPSYWVGIEDQAPGPADLVRDVVVAGEYITLGDGSEWVAPVVQKWDGETNLPRVMFPVIAPDGTRRTEMRLKPEFAEINALASKVFGYFQANTTISLDHAMQSATRLLAINYRLDVEEVGLLGLLNEETVVRVLEACIDYQGWRDQAAIAASQGLQPGEPREVT